MQTKQKTFADDDCGNPFITLGQLIHRGVSIQALTVAIRKDGIYTFDRVDLLCKANRDDLEIVSDCLVAQYDYEKDFGAYIESTGTPLSPLDLCEEPPRSAEEEKDRDNPFEQFGWMKNQLPDFENIKHPQIENELKPVNKLNRKAPDKFVAAFVRLLVEIAKRDKNINVHAMPGIKTDLLAVAIKFDADLECKEHTFDTYIQGLCKFKHGSRSGSYYQERFPEYFK